MEACATAHHWARELTKLGHQVWLMPAKDVKACVNRRKNDANDAAAICEAVTRPSMRFVPVKSAEQQGGLMLYRTRDLLMRQRTQVINALRAHMAEFGLCLRRGVGALSVRCWPGSTVRDWIGDLLKGAIGDVIAAVLPRRGFDPSDLGEQF